MFIFKTTQKRANPYAPYTAANGVRYPKIPLNLLDEIPDPQPPGDYTEETYYRTEQDDAPYVVYTRKSNDQIAAILRAKLPSTVSMYQARIALHQAGLLATVQAGIGQMSEEAQIKWEFAPTVKRDDALTVALASTLNLTEEQLDALFSMAGSIV